MSHYVRILETLKAKGWLKPDDAVLVVAGGPSDRMYMERAGMRNVVISNLDPHQGFTAYAPYEWRRLDAEHLELSDNTFDWVAISAGLHHLAVPALGVCEMFRVARKGVLCMEARDSLLMKFLVRLGLTDEYELDPIFLDGAGGLRGTAVPNYVYRWTEREFEKVVNSYAPAYRHTFFYEYGYSVPLQRFAMARNPFFRAVGWAFARTARLAELVLPKQGNVFAFGALKNTAPQPWMKPAADGSLAFDATYLAAKYDRERHPKRPWWDTGGQA